MPRKSKKTTLDSIQINELIESASLTDERLNAFWSLMARTKQSALADIDEKLWRVKNSDKFIRHLAAVVRQTGVARHFRISLGANGQTPAFADVVAAHFSKLISDESFDVVQAQFKRGFAEKNRAKVAATRAAGPLLARDSQPSTNNMGGTNYHPLSPEMVLSVTGTKKRQRLLEVTARKGPNDLAGFVDWCNFTVHEETCEKLRPYDHMQGTAIQLFPMVEDDDYIMALSARLESIFGFGVTQKRKGGMNFYKSSYVLGDKWGFVCIGGQRQTVLVMLNGSGCAAAKPGWEARLQDFLENDAVQPKITRLDVAHDDFSGTQYSVDRAIADWQLGLFTCYQVKPDIQRLGNHDEPNGKGRTVTIGCRASGKFGRVYEKGKQLGCPASEWVRVEVELKAVDRVIPFDCLTKPGAVLAATYPAFAWIAEDQKRIETIKKTTQTTYDSALFWLKRQYGALLGVVAEIEGSAAAAFEKIVIPNKVPPRLVVPDYRDVDPEFCLHNRPRKQALPLDAMVIFN